MDIGEVRFEKNYAVDLEGMRALVQVLHAKTGRLLAICGALITIPGILGIVEVARKGLDAFDSFALMCLLLGPFFLIYGPLFTRIVAKTSLKKQKSLTVPTLYQFGEDACSAETDDMCSAMRYGTIERIVLSRGYALLFITGISAQILPLSDFQVGDPALFTGFLAKKTGKSVERIGRQR